MKRRRDVEDWFDRAVDWYAARHNLKRENAAAVMCVAVESGDVFRALDAACERVRGVVAKLEGKHLAPSGDVRPGAL